MDDRRWTLLDKLSQIVRNFKCDTFSLNYDKIETKLLWIKDKGKIFVYNSVVIVELCLKRAIVQQMSSLVAYLKHRYILEYI